MKAFLVFVLAVVAFVALPDITNALTAGPASSFYNPQNSAAFYNFSYDGNIHGFSDTLPPCNYQYYKFFVNASVSFPTTEYWFQYTYTSSNTSYNATRANVFEGFPYQVDSGSLSPFGCKYDGSNCVYNAYCDFPYGPYFTVLEQEAADVAEPVTQSWAVTPVSVTLLNVTTLQTTGSAFTTAFRALTPPAALIPGNLPLTYDHYYFQITNANGWKFGRAMDIEIIPQSGVTPAQLPFAVYYNGLTLTGRNGLALQGQCNDIGSRAILLSTNNSIARYSTCNFKPGYYHIAVNRAAYNLLLSYSITLVFRDEPVQKLATPVAGTSLNPGVLFDNADDYYYENLTFVQHYQFNFTNSGSDFLLVTLTGVTDEYYGVNSNVGITVFVNNITYANSPASNGCPFQSNYSCDAKAVSTGVNVNATTCVIRIPTCRFNSGQWTFTLIADAFDYSIPIRYLLNVTQVTETVNRIQLAQEGNSNFGSAVGSVEENGWTHYLVDLTSASGTALFNDSYMFVQVYVNSEAQPNRFNVYINPNSKAGVESSCYSGFTRQCSIDTQGSHSYTSGSCALLMQQCELMPVVYYISVHQFPYNTFADPTEYTMFVTVGRSTPLVDQISIEGFTTQQEYVFYNFVVTPQTYIVGSSLEVEVSDPWTQKNERTVMEAYIQYGSLAGDCPCYSYIQRCLLNNFWTPNGLKSCNLYIPSCDFGVGTWYVGVYGEHQPQTQFNNTQALSFTITAYVHTPPVQQALPFNVPTPGSVSQANFYYGKDLASYTLNVPQVYANDALILTAIIQTPVVTGNDDNGTLLVYLNYGGWAEPDNLTNSNGTFDGCYLYSCSAVQYGGHNSYCQIYVEPCNNQAGNWSVTVVTSRPIPPNQGGVYQYSPVHYTLFATNYTQAVQPLISAVPVFGFVTANATDHYSIDVSPADIASQVNLNVEAYVNKDLDNFTIFINYGSKAGPRPPESCFDYIYNCSTVEDTFGPYFGRYLCSFQIINCDLQPGTYFIAVRGHNPVFYDIPVEYTLLATKLQPYALKNNIEQNVHTFPSRVEQFTAPYNFTSPAQSLTITYSPSYVIPFGSAELATVNMAWNTPAGPCPCGTTDDFWNFGFNINTFSKTWFQCDVEDYALPNTGYLSMFTFFSNVSTRYTEELTYGVFSTINSPPIISLPIATNVSYSFEEEDFYPGYAVFRINVPQNWGTQVDLRLLGTAGSNSLSWTVGSVVGTPGSSCSICSGSFSANGGFDRCVVDTCDSQGTLYVTVFSNYGARDAYFTLWWYQYNSSQIVQYNSGSSVKNLYDTNSQTTYNNFLMVNSSTGGAVSVPAYTYGVHLVSVNQAFDTSLGVSPRSTGAVAELNSQTGACTNVQASCSGGASTTCILQYEYCPAQQVYVGISVSPSVPSSIATMTPLTYNMVPATVQTINPAVTTFFVDPWTPKAYELNLPSAIFNTYTGIFFRFINLNNTAGTSVYLAKGCPSAFSNCNVTAQIPHYCVHQENMAFGTCGGCNILSGWFPPCCFGTSVSLYATFALDGLLNGFSTATPLTQRDYIQIDFTYVQGPNGTVPVTFDGTGHLSISTTLAANVDQTVQNRWRFYSTVLKRNVTGSQTLLRFTSSTGAGNPTNIYFKELPLNGFPSYTGLPDTWCQDSDGDFTGSASQFSPLEYVIPYCSLNDRPWGISVNNTNPVNSTNVAIDIYITFQGPIQLTYNTPFSNSLTAAKRLNFIGYLDTYYFTISPTTPLYRIRNSALVITFTGGDNGSFYWYIRQGRPNCNQYSYAGPNVLDGCQDYSVNSLFNTNRTFAINSCNVERGATVYIGVQNQNLTNDAFASYTVSWAIQNPNGAPKTLGPWQPLPNSQSFTTTNLTIMATNTTTDYYTAWVPSTVNPTSIFNYLQMKLTSNSGYHTLNYWTDESCEGSYFDTCSTSAVNFGYPTSCYLTYHNDPATYRGGIWLYISVTGLAGAFYNVNLTVTNGYYYNITVPSSYSPGNSYSVSGVIKLYNQQQHYWTVDMPALTLANMTVFSYATLDLGASCTNGGNAFARWGWQDYPTENSYRSNNNGPNPCSDLSSGCTLYWSSHYSPRHTNRFYFTVAQDYSSSHTQVVNEFPLTNQPVLYSYNFTVYLTRTDVIGFDNWYYYDSNTEQHKVWSFYVDSDNMGTIYQTFFNMTNGGWFTIYKWNTRISGMSYYAACGAYRACQITIPYNYDNNYYNFYADPIGWYTVIPHTSDIASIFVRRSDNSVPTEAIAYLDTGASSSVWDASVSVNHFEVISGLSQQFYKAVTNTEQSGFLLDVVFEENVPFIHDGHYLAVALAQGYVPDPNNYGSNDWFCSLNNGGKCCLTIDSCDLFGSSSSGNVDSLTLISNNTNIYMGVQAVAYGFSLNSPPTQKSRGFSSLDSDCKVNYTLSVSKTPMTDMILSGTPACWTGCVDFTHHPCADESSPTLGDYYAYYQVQSTSLFTSYVDVTLEDYSTSLSGGLSDVAVFLDHPAGAYTDNDCHAAGASSCTVTASSSPQLCTFQLPGCAFNNNTVIIRVRHLQLPLPWEQKQDFTPNIILTVCATTYPMVPVTLGTVYTVNTTTIFVIPPVTSFWFYYITPDSLYSPNVYESVGAVPALGSQSCLELFIDSECRQYTQNTYVTVEFDADAPIGATTNFYPQTWITGGRYVNTQLNINQTVNITIGPGADAYTSFGPVPSLNYNQRLALKFVGVEPANLEVYYLVIDDQITRLAGPQCSGDNTYGTDYYWEDNYLVFGCKVTPRSKIYLDLYPGSPYVGDYICGLTFQIMPVIFTPNCGDRIITSVIPISTTRVGDSILGFNHQDYVVAPTTSTYDYLLHVSLSQVASGFVSSNVYYTLLQACNQYDCGNEYAGRNTLCKWRNQYSSVHPTCRVGAGARLGSCADLYCPFTEVSQDSWYIRVLGSPASWVNTTSYSILGEALLPTTSAPGVGPFVASKNDLSYYKIDLSSGPQSVVIRMYHYAGEGFHYWITDTPCNWNGLNLKYDQQYSNHGACFMGVCQAVIPSEVMFPGASALYIIIDMYRATQYGLTWSLGSNNCASGTAGLTFCSSVVSYNRWQNLDDSILDESSQNLYDQLVLQYSVCSQPSSSCLAAIQRFACYFNFRECEANTGFVTPICRQDCLAMEAACGSLCELVNATHTTYGFRWANYDLLQCNSDHYKNNETCTGTGSVSTTTGGPTTSPPPVTIGTTNATVTTSPTTFNATGTVSTTSTTSTTGRRTSTSTTGKKTSSTTTTTTSSTTGSPAAIVRPSLFFVAISFVFYFLASLFGAVSLF